MNLSLCSVISLDSDFVGEKLATPISWLFEAYLCPFLLAVLLEELGGVGTQDAGMEPDIIQPVNVLFNTFIPGP